jgi:hypothetical protein
MKNHEELRVLAGGEQPAGKMERRRAIQVLLGGAAAGMVIPGVAASHPVRDHIAHHAASTPASTPASDAPWKPVFLDAHQNESLIVLAERILPGSSQAQVNRFIDLALSIERQATQDQFLRALAAFEGEALARFRSTFVQLTEAQQIEILTAAAISPVTDVSKVRSGDWVSATARGFTPPQLVTLGDYLEYLKGWISGAYYSSEIGMKELGWTGNSVYEDYPGCQHPEGHH